MKNTKKKKNKKNQKKPGFTLIELLAVIIILGVIMLVAIPSVTNYINDSRKNSYITTARELIGGAKNMVNSGEQDVFDLDTTYYIPTSCIPVETGGDSPYGPFDPAYVIVSYNGDGFDYYWASTDTTKMGIYHEQESTLSVDSIKAGVNNIDSNVSMAPDSLISVMDPTTCKFGEKTQASSFSLPTGIDPTDKYTIQNHPVYYNFSDDYSYIKTREGRLYQIRLNSLWDFYWAPINGHTSHLFLLYNDNALNKYATLHIKMPTITDNETGRNVSVSKYFYEMDVVYNYTEHWTCTGTGSQEFVNCTPKTNYVAQSFPIDNDYTYEFIAKLTLLLDDGNYINVDVSNAAHGYFSYYVGDYDYQTLYAYGAGV